MDNPARHNLRGYELAERIGRGNFGEVYRAFQPVIEREVAIKLILPTYANHPEFIRRFETEAHLIARLEHPHIVPLFDYWREPDRAYLVMRLLPNNLRKILSNGPLSLSEAVRVVDQIASALTLAHRQDVIHRDIKPDNILFDDDGNAYLTDFGLAKVYHESFVDTDEGITGSPAYMSPEQIKNDPITPAADVYAMGLLIYEMVTGEHPFVGLSMVDTITHQLYELVPSINASRYGLPEGINTIIQHATVKEVEYRYPDVRTLASEFRNMAAERHAVAVIVESTTHIENPYKGLRAFQEADAADFFGRTALIKEMLRLMGAKHEMARFLAVIGPSGSGKSSLVHAGLIPALRKDQLPGSEKWFIVTLTPGQQPIKELATALLRVASAQLDLTQLLEENADGLLVAAKQILADTDGDLLLVIDQFEELFTYEQPESERRQFLNVLHTAVTAPDSRIRLIISLRADFYDRPLLYEDFGKLMQARTQVVLPLTTLELEQAIIAPAERVDVVVEPNLVAAMVADVRQEPGALPLLQYALTEVFERREGRTITLQAYEDIGKVAGALARRAENVFNEMPLEQQTIAAQIFLRLVTLGEGTEDTRRRVNRSELMSIVNDTTVLESVLQTFGRHRLLSFDHDQVTREPTVEVAHEALIREWGRLRQWLDNSREDVRQQRRLAHLTSEWLAAGKDPSFLLRGVQLQQFEYWLQNANIALTQNEQALVDASSAAHQEREDEERRRHEREVALERRARRFLQTLLAVMGVALLVAMGLSLVALDQRSEAEDAQGIAERNANIAQTEAAVASRRADELQSLSLVNDAERALEANNIDLALALALEANRIANAPLQAQNLLNAIAPNATVRVLEGHQDRVTTVAECANGILSGSDDGMLILWDSSALPHRFELHTSSVNTIACHNTSALSGGDDGELLVWDTDTGDILYHLEGHEDDILAAAFSPDGTVMISGSRDETIISWDAETGELLRRFEDGHDGRITSVAISPNGNIFASGSTDSSIVLWDSSTGDIVQRLTAHTDTVTDLAFNNDGSRLLSGSVDTSVIVWDVDSGQPVHQLTGHTERVTGVAFAGKLAISSAGSPFAGTVDGNSLILWDTGTGQQIRRYLGHDLQVTDVSFLNNGHYAVSASADGTLRLWATHFDIGSLEYETNTPINAAALDPADSITILATEEEDRNILLWHRRDESGLFTTTHSASILGLAISPSGDEILSASADGMLHSWSLPEGNLIHSFDGHSNEVHHVVYSSDGQQALSGSRDRRLILWDTTTGEIVRAFDALHTNTINAVALNADDDQALSASADQSLILWDVATGERLLALRNHTNEVLDVAFGPDGKTAVSASMDKTLILWDLTSGDMLQQYGSVDDGHTDWVTAVAISPDGMFIASGSRDRSVRIWEANTGQEVRRYSSLGESIIDLEFTPDSQGIMAAIGDGTVHVLPVTAEAFNRWVEANRYLVSLTCEEHFHPESCPPSDPAE